MTAYTIIGAGAIGGTVGAYMARNGSDITFVDTEKAHVEAINSQGLTIRGYQETFTVSAKAITPDALFADLQAVLLAVKAPATRTACAQLAPHLSPNGYVVSLQNGLNEVEIARIVGAERVIGCFINFSADYIEPGLVHFGGPGAFWIGELNGEETPRLRRLQQDLNAWAGGEVQITGNIWGFLWGKMAYGAMLFATALTNDSMAGAIDANRPLMVALAREVLAVADAEGVQPYGFDGFEPDTIRTAAGSELSHSLDRLVEVRRHDQKTHSGVWRDLAVRKRKTEADAMYTPIRERARAHNIATPLLDKMIEIVHEIEQDKRPLSTDNLDELSASM